MAGDVELIPDPDDEDNVELTPVDKPGLPVERQPKDTGRVRKIPSFIPGIPVSNQFVAGLTDIATAMPMIGGLGTGLVNTIGDQITGEEGSFSDQFKKRISTGTAGDLIKAGADARRYANEFLGVEEPRSTTEQAVRLGGNFFPIPLGAAGTAAGKIGHGLLYATTPVVRGGSAKQIALRGAGQGLIAGGLDQGLRAYLDDPVNAPLIFSEAAGLTREEAAKRFATDVELIDDEEVQREVQADVELLPADTETDMALISPEDIEADFQVQRQQDKNTNRIILSAVGAGVAALAIARYGAIRRAKMSQPISGGGTTSQGRPDVALGRNRQFFSNIGSTVIDPNLSVGAKTDRLKALAGGRVERLKGDHVDAVSIINKEFKDKGITGPIDSIDHAKSGDSFGMARTVYNDGLFGGDISRQFQSDLSGKAMANVQRSFNNLSPKDRETFVVGLAADQARVGRHLARDPTTGVVPEDLGLYDRALGRYVKNTEIDTRIKNVTDNLVLRKMREDYGKIMNDWLKYMVERGSLDQATVDLFTDQVKSVDSIFVPGMQAGAIEGFFMTTARRMGLYTQEGTDLAGISNLLSRARNAATPGAGINFPEEPFTSAAIYMGNMMEHLNNNSLRHMIFAPLSGVVDNIGKRSIDFTKIKIADGHIVMPDWYRAPTDRNAIRYLGMADPNAPLESRVGTAIVPDVISPDDPIAKQILRNTSPKPLIETGAAQYGENIVVVQRHGQQHLYYVRDPSLRIAATVNPELTRVMRFNNFFRNTLTQGTTGKYSLFAPTSGLFTAQQAALSAAIRTGRIDQGLVEATKVFGDSARGTVEVFRKEAGRAWADILSKDLATNTGLASINPQLTQRLFDRFEKWHSNTVLSAIQAQSGRTATGLGAEDIRVGINSILQDLTSTTKDSTGLRYIQGLGKTWTALNLASREGTPAGMSMRRLAKAADEMAVEIGQVPPSKIRQIVSEVKDITGDTARAGASRPARHLVSAIPFASPTIQAWNSIGMAINKIGVGKGMLLLGGVIGIPTVAELLTNHAIMYTDVDENGELRKYIRPGSERIGLPIKEWTQHDYFWNGFSESQRVENLIIMIPGRPPWEAILMPIGPELSLARAITIEALDAVMSLSSVGRAGDLDENGAHIWAAAARTFDIPTPPLFDATLNTFGIDVRMGSQHVTDTQGEKFALVAPRIRSQGQRKLGLTDDRGKFTGSFHGETFSNIVQSIFGAIGTAYLQFAEAFAAGMSSSGIARGFSDGLEAIGDEASRQARYAQPLIGQALRPNRDNKISRDLFAKKSRLTSLSQHDYGVITRLGIMDAKGNEIPGNTLIPPDDPIFRDIVLGSRPVLSSVNELQKQASYIQNAITSLRNATSSSGDPTANNISYRERQNRIDALTLALNSNRGEQLYVIKQFEADISEVMSTHYGRQITIEFDKIRSRLNIGEGPILPRPPKPLPPSLPQR